MKSHDHAEYCKNIRWNLKQDLYDETGENIEPVLSSAYCADEADGVWPVYCHPDDEEKRYVSEYEYSHREI